MRHKQQFEKILTVLHDDSLTSQRMTVSTEVLGVSRNIIIFIYAYIYN